MKTFVILGSFVALMFSASSCSHAHRDAASTKEAASTTTVTSAESAPSGSTMGGFVEDKMTFKIKGMTCETCSGKVEKAIKNVPGVATAKVSHKTGMAEVTSSGPSKLERKTVIKAIQDAGYKVQE